MSPEVQEAAGREGEGLENRAERLRSQIAATKRPEQELAQVERQLKERDAAALKREAEARLLGIVRAVGSLASNLEQDDVRLLAAATAYAKAMTMLNERFLKARMYQAEALALVEVFGLPTPELPAVVVPCQRRDVREAGEIVAQAQPRETFFVEPQRDERTTRRTFAEISGTEGFALIQRKS